MLTPSDAPFRVPRNRLVLVLMVLAAPFALMAGTPVVNTATVDTNANSIVISGVNLLGPDGGGVSGVRFGNVKLNILSSSATSITAGFPAGSPASSFAPGSYLLTLNFFYVITPVDSLIFQVTIGGSTPPNNPPPTTTPSGLVMSVEGISCTTSAGSHAFQVTAWSGSAAPQATALTVSKLFDDCSSELLKKAFMGQVLPSAVLTQYAGSSAAMTIRLDNAVVSSYAENASAANPTPTEMVGFSYARITVTDVVRGKVFCWDVQQARACQ